MLKLINIENTIWVTVSRHLLEDGRKVKSFPLPSSPRCLCVSTYIVIFSLCAVKRSCSMLLIISAILVWVESVADDRYWTTVRSWQILHSARQYCLIGYNDTLKSQTFLCNLLSMEFSLSVPQWMSFFPFNSSWSFLQFSKIKIKIDDSPIIIWWRKSINNSSHFNEYIGGVCKNL